LKGKERYQAYFCDMLLFLKLPPFYRWYI